jgi:hypothetical protein
MTYWNVVPMEAEGGYKLETNYGGSTYSAISMGYANGYIDGTHTWI